MRYEHISWIWSTFIVKYNGHSLRIRGHVIAAGNAACNFGALLYESDWLQRVT